MTWLALDIGGANLKVSDGLRYSASEPFALWRQLERLPHAIAHLIAQAPAYEQVAVTMTGELADCFATRHEGVQAIIDAARQAMVEQPLYVYQTDGELYSVDDPRRDARLAAASNWHALATYACRLTDGLPSMLMDVGSTTVDLIPLDQGCVAARGQTDIDRLIHGELLYTGFQRSPICAVVGALPYRGHEVPVAQELFATTDDAYVTLGATAEDRSSRDTADGRPRTILAARRRLGRVICTELNESEANRVAEEIVEAQVRSVAGAWQKACSVLHRPPERIVVSGQGAYLADRVLTFLGVQCEIVRLTDLVGVEASRVAPAYALATLARERFAR